MFNSPKHSDHHAFPAKEFQLLKNDPSSPQLPHGFLLMVHIAFSPLDWFRIMDPLVDYYARHPSSVVPEGLMGKARAEAHRFLNVHTLAFGAIAALAATL